MRFGALVLLLALCVGSAPATIAGAQATRADGSGVTGQLSDEDLSRAAVQSWSSTGPTGAGSELGKYFSALAQRGDQAAANLIALLNSTGMRPLKPLRKEAATSASSAICERNKIGSAVSGQLEAYSRLLETRGYSPEPAMFPALDRRDDSLGPSLYARLPHGVAILLYAHDDRRHCVWLMDQSGVVAFEALYSTPAFGRALLGSFYDAEGIAAAQLSRAPVPKTKPPAQPQEVVANFRGGADALRALSAYLLPASVGQRAIGYSRLIVAPYGAIGAAPFAALPVAGGALIDHSAITIAPDLEDLLAAHSSDYQRTAKACGQRLPASSSKARFQRPLIVGDPAYADPEFNLPPLPGARAESTAVANVLGARPLQGGAATHASVVGAMADADLLYFATHGVSYNQRGLNGFVALAGGRLTASEVQAQCLARARVVVLSACQTGLGQYEDGGVIGLARAFRLAGASDVVMSLWNVDDLATRDLMTGFMQELNRGASTAIALRTAALAVRKNYPSPKAWASFAVLTDAFD